MVRRGKGEGARVVGERVQEPAFQQSPEGITAASARGGEEETCERICAVLLC